MAGLVRGSRRPDAGTYFPKVADDPDPHTPESGRDGWGRVDPGWGQKDIRLRSLQDPPGRIEDCLRARAPGDKHAAHALQPEHAQGRGSSVLGDPTDVIGCA